MPNRPDQPDARTPDDFQKPDTVLKNVSPGSPAPPPAGALFGKYRLERVLGKGGMGEVWLATDTTVDRLVALKRPLVADDIRLARLRREAKLVARLDDHPGVCRLYEIGEINGQFYLALGYVRGQTLADVLATHPAFAPHDAVAIARQVAEILDYAHGRGVLHRDLKPTNIMIQNGGLPVVMDFGLSARLDAGDHSLSQSGELIGTVPYMAPEQTRGEHKEMNPTWDIYSLGIVLYEMLTGRRAFTAPNIFALIVDVQSKVPPRPSSLRAEVDPRLDVICLKAMAKEAKDRYPSMAAFGKALADYQTPVAIPKVIATPERGERFTARGAFGAMTFAFVPKGTFWMSEKGKNAQRQVTIADDFFLGIYPVTQGQWQAVMGENPSYFSRTGGGRDAVKTISDADLLLFPVESVSWNDVQEFLRRVNGRNGSGTIVYRLPTEAQWEYACRGGHTTPTDCAFDFSVGAALSKNLSSENANFDGNHPDGAAPLGPFLKRTSQVGSYPPNALGIYDLHGNVWEWTAFAEGAVRVLRGGGWSSHGRHCRAADRSRSAPSAAYRDSGFRLVRSSRPISEPGQ